MRKLVGRAAVLIVSVLLGCSSQSSSSPFAGPAVPDGPPPAMPQGVPKFAGSREQVQKQMQVFMGSTSLEAANHPELETSAEGVPVAPPNP